MFLTSRWFPVGFAVLQTIRYVAMIGYEYWDAERSEKNFDARAYIKHDLARPWSEEQSICFLHHHPTPVEMIDLPARVAAFFVLSSLTACPTDVLTMPRGQILTAFFVPPVWCLVGLSWRRLAQRRWRMPSNGAFRGMVWTLGLIGGAIGMLLVLMASVGAFSEPWPALGVFGLSFWLLYFALLSAERLRTWPFANLQTTPS